MHIFFLNVSWFMCPCPTLPKPRFPPLPPSLKQWFSKWGFCRRSSGGGSPWNGLSWKGASPKRGDVGHILGCNSVDGITAQWRITALSLVLKMYPRIFSDMQEFRADAKGFLGAWSEPTFQNWCSYNAAPRSENKHSLTSKKLPS